MTSKQFAELNVDSVVKLSAIGIKDYHVSNMDGLPFGICVGYYGAYIVIKVAEYLDTSKIKQNISYARLVNTTILSKKVGEQENLFYVNPSAIEICEEIKPVNPYPHVCKNCKAPARRCVGFVMCSNNNCKTRKTIKHAVGLDKISNCYVDYDGYIICTECKQRAISTFGEGCYRCRNDHSWPYSPKKNDYLYCELTAHKYGIYVYDRGWQNISYGRIGIKED